MPHPIRLPCCLLAAALALGACRPADAPKEPTEPAEPTVSLETPRSGGVSLAVARRSSAPAKL